MNYRQFGKTNLRLSEVGFGAWAIGGGATVGNIPIGWGDTDDAISEKALLAAIDAGINFFDTADFYGLGHSEELIGKVLGRNKNAIIATKVGHRNIDNKIVLDYSKEYIFSACDESLRRLKREAIDYYQLHSARLDHLHKGECIEAMEGLKQKGKIRYWGLSLNTFHPQPEAEYLIDLKKGDGFQLVFNLINQRADDTLKLAARAGFGVIARMPLQFGLLTGKFNRNSSFDRGDHRAFRLTAEIIEKAMQKLNDRVWPTAEKLKINKTSFALSYILSHPEISTVIPGIRNAEQVKMNTIDLRQLDPSLIKQLEHPEMKWNELVELMERQG
jgi:aryl-alcohol dehydrogenase-like predicted oxidoreductase